jgi:hypothetical protein
MYSITIKNYIESLISSDLREREERRKIVQNKGKVCLFVGAVKIRNNFQ